MDKNHQQQINKIVVILGPTSAGKSAVAIKIAREFGGEIISADSRQIYRGMNIGTGKVTGSIKTVIPSLPRDLVRDSSTPILSAQNDRKGGIFLSEGVLHHMIDIVSPRTNFSAAQFKKKADKIIGDILKRGKLPILCGGTGFWIKSVVDNIAYPEVKPDRDLRKRLDKESAEKLFEKLKKLDPERAKNIDAKNKVRLIRAIEICKAIGKVPIQATWDTAQETRDLEFIQIGISVPKEKLHTKIKKRLNDRWRDGMIEEVKKLHNPLTGKGLSWKKIQSFGLGYFWIPEYLKKKITLEELYEKVYLAEKDYAKRQLTWFRKDSRILWLENYKNIKKETRRFLSK